MPGRFNTWTLALAVAAALLIGFAVSTLAYRYRILHVPGEPMVLRMERELHLSQAQMIQIRDIMADTRIKVMQAQQNFRRARRQAFGQALQQIRETLTPEQQQKFDREFLPYASERNMRENPEGEPRRPPPPPPPPPEDGEGGL